jgi:hypothetical protein
MGADVRIADKPTEPLPTRNAKMPGQDRELKSDLDFAALEVKFAIDAYAMRSPNDTDEAASMRPITSKSSTTPASRRRTSN